MSTKKQPKGKVTSTAKAKNSAAPGSNPEAETTNKPPADTAPEATANPPAEGAAPVEEKAPGAAEAQVVKAPEKAPKESKKDSRLSPMLERAKKVFAQHAVDTLYFTSDNTAFLEPQYARIHSESLTSQEVTTIERKEIL
ncbi:MAG: hypothetical protein NTU51_05935 [Bacteroidetes bacterium]|nr:hypothetical protein [Bacteroidota bacterium]